MNALEKEKMIANELGATLSEACDFFSRVSDSDLVVGSELTATDIGEYNVKLDVDNLTKEQVERLAQFIRHLSTEEI